MASSEVFWNWNSRKSKIKCVLTFYNEELLWKYINKSITCPYETTTVALFVCSGTHVNYEIAVYHVIILVIVLASCCVIVLVDVLASYHVIVLVNVLV